MLIISFIKEVYFTINLLIIAILFLFFLIDYSKDSNTVITVVLFNYFSNQSAILTNNEGFWNLFYLNILLKAVPIIRLKMIKNIKAKQADSRESFNSLFLSTK